MKNGKYWHILFLISCLLIFGGAAFAQDDTATREITSLDFQKQRPKAGGGSVGSAAGDTAKVTPKRKKNIAVVTNKKRRYNLVKRVPAKPVVAVKNEQNKITKPANKILKNEQVGVTFWRLRPAAADEADEPLFSVRLGERRENWAAERVGSTTLFNIGDRVRFTIEASRSGFLYIVNREFYADGTSGTANIIFPTLRTRGGDNRVAAGSLIEIPASTDSVPYFTIKPNRADYAGEELLIIISPVKLPVEIGLQAQPVTRTVVQKWLDDWGATVDIYDAEDGEGIAYTRIEAEAATTTSRALTQEEPLPQTIYRVKIGEGDPLIVPFQMRAETP